MKRAGATCALVAGLRAAGCAPGLSSLMQNKHDGELESFTVYQGLC